VERFLFVPVGAGESITAGWAVMCVIGDKQERESRNRGGWS
jgi:hypothetical protein